MVAPLSALEAVTLALVRYLVLSARVLKQIALLWDYIRDVTEANAPLLMGQTREMVFAQD